MRARLDFFSEHQGDPLKAPIELAREVVFDSPEHAYGLGLDLHRHQRAAEARLHRTQMHICGQLTRPALRSRRRR